MNKKITSILVFVFIFLWMTHGAAVAQSKTILGVVHYQTHEDLMFLFQNSTRTLVYLSGEKVEEPTYVGLFSDAQRNNIETRDLRFRTLDENADISRYIMLYNPQPDQGSKLEYLGEPMQFTKRFTLLKLNKGKEYSHEGIAGEFFEIPFLEGIVPPPNATPVTPLTQPTVTPRPSEKDGNNFLILIVAIVFVIGVISAGVVLYLKKKGDSSQPQF